MWGGGAGAKSIGNTKKGLGKNDNFGAKIFIQKKVT